MNYLVRLPSGYNVKKRILYPAIFFLHGAHERGNNLDLIKKVGPPSYAEQQKRFPFIVIAPQCPDFSRWADLDLMQLMENSIKKYNIDRKKIYLTGFSMGGYGAWNLAIEHPDFFAAIAPVCGGGYAQKSDRIKDLPVWVFHGDSDEIIPIEKSKEMVAALNAAGNKQVKFTIYKNTGHDSWTPTYNNPELYRWFLTHKKH